MPHEPLVQTCSKVGLFIFIFIVLQIERVNGRTDGQTEEQTGKKRYASASQYCRRRKN